MKELPYLYQKLLRMIEDDTKRIDARMERGFKRLAIYRGVTSKFRINRKDMQKIEKELQEGKQLKRQNKHKLTLI
jgi:hypothetical protein